MARQSNPGSRPGTQQRGPDAPASAAPSARDWESLFGGAAGLFLALGLLKFGNPVIFDKEISAPKDLFELLLMPWPVAWGYGLLVAVLLLGLKVWSWKVPAPRWVVVLPLAWLGWQGVAATQTVQASLTWPTLQHFVACVLCFYLGLFALSRVRDLRLFWLGLLGGFLLVIFWGWRQHWGGLEETRRFFHQLPNWQDYPPEFIKKVDSDRIYSTLFYPNALAGVILLLLPLLVRASWGPLRFSLGRVGGGAGENQENKGTPLPGPLPAPSSRGEGIRWRSVGRTLACGPAVGSRSSPSPRDEGAGRGSGERGSLNSHSDDDQHRCPKARMILSLLAILAALACLYWSGSKAGWLIMLGMGLVAFLRLPLPRRTKGLVAVVVLAAGVGGFAARHSGYFRKGATSASARIDYWQAALQVIREHPLTGSGPGTFGVRYRALKRPEAEMTRLTHNDYLQQGSDSGIPGLALYGMLLAGSVALLYRRSCQNPLAFAVWLGLFGLAVQGLVEFGLYIPALAWPQFLFLGWLWGISSPRNPIDNPARAGYSPAAP